MVVVFSGIIFLFRDISRYPIVKARTYRQERNNNNTNWLFSRGCLDSETSLKDIINHEGLVHVSEQIPENDRWTHHWSRGNEYRQLDYILLSKSLAEINNSKPEIMRKGLPYRAEKYDGELFDYI